MFGVSLGSCDGHETEYLDNLQDTAEMEMEESYDFEQGRPIEKTEINNDVFRSGMNFDYFNDALTNSVDKVETEIEGVDTVKLDIIF